MWVVKLGGSLLSGEYLRPWLETLIESHRALVVVPGGGAFADQVRAAQQRWGLDDHTAHCMAILAMEQTAHLFCGLAPRLGRLVDPATLETRRRLSGAQVWFPAASSLADESIPRSWDVTSDSLAALLARRVQADGLVLVKSPPLEGFGGRVGELQAVNLVDGAFDHFGARCGCPVWLLGREHWGDLPRLLRGRGETALAVAFPRGRLR